MGPFRGSLPSPYIQWGNKEIDSGPQPFAHGLKLDREKGRHRTKKETNTESWTETAKETETDTETEIET